MRTAASGATTVVMSRPSVMMPGLVLAAMTSRKIRTSALPHRGDPRDPGSPRRSPAAARMASVHVGAADPHQVVLRVGAELVVEVVEQRERRRPGRPGRRRGPARCQASGPVGGAGVLVVEAERAAPPRGSRWTCRCRPGRRPRRRRARRSPPGLGDPPAARFELGDEVVLDLGQHGDLGEADRGARASAPAAGPPGSRRPRPSR